LELASEKKVVAQENDVEVDWIGRRLGGRVALTEVGAARAFWRTDDP
jgi:hypothetical protein